MTKRPKTSVFYAYRKRGKYCIAVCPPGFPLPDDSEHSAREREDVEKWIETKTKKGAA